MLPDIIRYALSIACWLLALYLFLGSMQEDDVPVGCIGYMVTVVFVAMAIAFWP